MNNIKYLDIELGIKFTDRLQGVLLEKLKIFHWYICAAFAISMLFSLIGCRKLVEADAPRTSLSQANVYATDASAIAVLTGLFQVMAEDNLFTGGSSISLMAGLSADEFSLSSEVPSNDLKYFHYIDSLFSNSNGSRGTQYWTPFYNYIYQCNAAIEGLLASDKLTNSIKQQLLGEAKFVRAFLYFYLANLYGDIPIVRGTDWQISAALGRVTEDNIYEQIIEDLNDSKALLSSNYLDANIHPYLNTFQRVRPTKWAATALLARAYLFKGDWANAEANATEVINNNSLFSLTQLNGVFLKNSLEAIWQLQPTKSGQNTNDAVIYLLPSSGPSLDYPVFLSPQLLASFEVGDKRRFGRNWIDSIIVGTDTFYFPYKYKVGIDAAVTEITQLTEYVMVLRLSEQYLIRAEARMQQNNLTSALSDLNAIRDRAGLPDATANDKTTLLSAIVHEKQVELFSEWGHRWLDLKRTGNVDVVMGLVRPLKANGSPWHPFQQLYPILFDDILRNGNLTQNPGY